ncbi:ABC transporter ATP-binding protein [Iamia majanohamensis]|uniref:ABC transporter ATP-binding protein n=1 Tax=Iamia majanohamensis TaxID=467976 RepID=A0AAE9Y9T4_9ACTN|nr:ABC transporter ATP-binding protein [Iamia majanohamensis]WCO67188.1 ABC transporter ATP-binding protein [Iamia majanohamensis]
MAAVEVDDIVVHRGPEAAVDGVSFQLERGEVLALLGPNGAGKTTTVETLEGLLTPTEGRVRVLGLDPAAEHAALMPHLGAMPQQGGVYPGARAREVLDLVAAFHADPAPPGEVLERVGLSHKARAEWRTLSGGEQQRLSLALALVGRPDVVILDEPTAGIDPSGRLLVRQLIADLRTAGLAVLITTHDLEEAEKVADCVVIIDRGRVVASGSPAELMRAAGSHEIRFGAPPGLDTAALGKTLLVAVDEVAPGEYVVAAEATPSNINALTGWLATHDLPLADLRAGRQSLEDVFLRLTTITGETPVVRVDAARRPRTPQR